jgi:hypothetical protein
MMLDNIYEILDTILPKSLDQPHSCLSHLILTVGICSHCNHTVWAASDEGVL